jgi:hypothetical protein
MDTMFKILSLSTIPTPIPFDDLKEYNEYIILFLIDYPF